MEIASNAQRKKKTGKVSAHRSRTEASFLGRSTTRPRLPSADDRNARRSRDSIASGPLMPRNKKQSTTVAVKKSATTATTTETTTTTTTARTMTDR